MANVKKKSKVVMLPTEKANAGSLIINDNGSRDKSMWKQLTGNSYFTQEYLKSVPAKSFHLFITSDELIQEGDFFVRDNEIHQCYKVHETDIEFKTIKNSVYCGVNTFWDKKYCKKIIATTDSSLKLNLTELEDLNGMTKILPQPSPQFIEKYIEAYNAGNPIVDVMVEYEEVELYSRDIPRHLIKPEDRDMFSKLKVDKNNYITITKCKESWSRSEVEALLRKTYSYAFSDGQNDESSPSYMTIDKWIEDNL